MGSFRYKSETVEVRKLKKNYTWGGKAFIRSKASRHSRLCFSGWTLRRQQRVLSKISEASGSDSSESLTTYQGNEKSKTSSHYPTRDDLLKNDIILSCESCTKVPNKNDSNNKFATEKRKPKVTASSCQNQSPVKKIIVDKTSEEVEPYGFPSLKRNEVGESYIEAILLGKKNFYRLVNVNNRFYSWNRVDDIVLRQ